MLSRDLLCEASWLIGHRMRLRRVAGRAPGGGGVVRTDAMCRLRFAARRQTSAAHGTADGWARARALEPAWL